MSAVQPGPLEWGVGVSVGVGVGIAVGGACALVVLIALRRGLARHGRDRLGPADRVTLTRALLACGVAGLTAQSVRGPQLTAAIVTLAFLALALDAVDGVVARRTGTASALGARFDMETDAFLIAVLSIYVARSYGPWVLAIGAARYAFVAAGWAMPWLREQLPARSWRRVVAAVQGVVLTVVAAQVLPRPAALSALVVALLLLAESFGRDVATLWRRRPARTARAGWPRRALAAAGSAVAALSVWAALIAPDRADGLHAGALLAVPLEGVVLLVLLALLPGGTARTTALVAGLALGALTVLRIVDLGFTEALGRPFDPLGDVGYLGSAVGMVASSTGRLTSVLVVATAVAALLGTLVLLAWSTLRLARLAGRHRRAWRRATAAACLAWAVCAGLGLQSAPGKPVAAAGVTSLVHDHAVQARDGWRDSKALATAIADDPFRAAAGADLLAGLRGKDVLFVFVESYGRVALDDPELAAYVDPVLDRWTDRLRTAGFSSRSAYLTSSTFGGASWLAHSTLQTGVWIDSQRRYDRVVDSDRLTLSAAFRGAGWRTVAVVPANRKPWPVGSDFYRYEQVLDSRNLGYAGPAAGYTTMPDQYTLSAFERRELAGQRRRPVMAEVDLLSSHIPWPPPTWAEWSEIADGSVFGESVAQRSPAVLPAGSWRDPARARPAYARSIAYSLTAVASFVQTYGDEDLVVVFLGDHQPSTIVSGTTASHDVPVTLVARDRAVVDRIAGWRWTDGLQPGPGAPAWRMDTFRNRFLTTFS